jgi:DNA-binding beta-propeller fold protein YncE
MYVSLLGSRFENDANPLNLKVLDKINVINTDNNVIEQEITVQKGPTSIAHDLVHQRMYVTIFGSEDLDGIKDGINTICI